jgi:dihydroflavonol-4-reductase
MSRILVTGGTGFVGSHLTKKLSELGHDVLVLTRKSSDLSNLNGIRYQLSEGDITNKNSILAAAEGCEAIFHLAGHIAYKKSERELMDKINIFGTENVVKVCETLQTPNLIFMSSVVAVGASFSPNEVLNENSPFTLSRLNLGYFETKRAAEKLVFNLSREKFTRCITVNPSTIYGPADAKKGSRRTQVKVAQGKFPFYTSGGVSVVDIEDVVQGIILAWQKGKSGERYILSGENLTIHELFLQIAKAANVKPPQFRIPNFALHWLGGIGDLRAAIGAPSSLSRENAWTASLYHWFDCSKAKRELGFQFRPAIESIEKSVLWMQKNGLLN